MRATKRVRLSKGRSSIDYLNLLINRQAFSDVTFTVEGRQVHAHRYILAAQSPFFCMIFCTNESMNELGGRAVSTASPQMIPVGIVGYEIFLLLLQFLYSGQVSIVPQKHEARPNYNERGHWHTHCTSAIDLALDMLTAAQRHEGSNGRPEAGSSTPLEYMLRPGSQVWIAVRVEDDLAMAQTKKNAENKPAGEKKPTTVEEKKSVAQKSYIMTETATNAQSEVVAVVSEMNEVRSYAATTSWQGDIPMMGGP
eukprot:Gb_06351 [translate_table: standard]